MLRLIFMLIPLLWAGCTRRVYVPYETHASLTDSAYRAVNTSDTLIMRDSVTTFVRGDTVHRITVRDRLRTRTRSDTVVRTVRDTVSTVRTIAVEKEKPRSAAHDALRNAGLTFSFALAVSAVWVIVRRRWSRGR